MTQRIDPASDRAVYRQIADNLRAKIERGEYEPGAQLPSESQIMSEYDVSRVTARHALGVLVTAGLVIAEAPRAVGAAGRVDHPRAFRGLGEPGPAAGSSAGTAQGD